MAAQPPAYMCLPPSFLGPHGAVESLTSYVYFLKCDLLMRPTAPSLGTAQPPEPLSRYPKSLLTS